MSKGWYPVINYDNCVGCMIGFMGMVNVTPFSLLSEGENDNIMKAS